MTTDVGIRPPDGLDTNEHRVAALELRVSELYLAKRPVPEIMRETGVNYYQYTELMKRISVRFREQAMRNGLERVGEEILQLDRLQRMYEDAWEHSKTRKRKTRTKVAPIRKKPTKRADGITQIGSDEEETPTHGVTERVTEEEEQIGDEKFLAGILRCIDRRVKLMGLDSPDKLIVGIENGVEGNGSVFEDRYERYKSILSLPGGHRRSANEDPGEHDPGEPVDPNRPAPETGRVLDVSGRVRQ